MRSTSFWAFQDKARRALIVFRSIRRVKISLNGQVSLLNEIAAIEKQAIAPDATPAATILRIDNLQTHFFTAGGVVRAVDGVSYSVKSGETLGVVGEPGCGKSVTALAVLRLVANPPGRIVGGAIHFDGRNLLDLSEAEMESIR